MKKVLLDKKEIYKITNNFRLAILDAKEDRRFYFRDRMSNFPSGCCDDASDLLAYFLLESFNRFLIISLDVLICRYSPLFRAFPALFISEEPHKSFYYPSCFRSQK